MLNHNFFAFYFRLSECFLVRSKKCVSAPKGWRTVFDFASASSYEAKSACQPPKAGARSLILRVQS